MHSSSAAPSRWRWSLVLALLVTLLSWSSAFVAIRLAVRWYDPAALTLFRFMVAAVVLSAAFAVGGADRGRPAGNDWLRLLAAGLTGVVAYHLLLNTGERVVPAGIASLLVCTTQLFTAVLAVAFLGERLALATCLGGSLAFLGVFLLSTGGSVALHLNLGAVAILGAAAGQSVFFVIQKPMLGRLRPLDVAAWYIWIATVALLPAAPRLLEQMRAAPTSATLAGLFLGIVPSALANVTWGMVLQELPASIASSWLFLVPPLAVAMGWAVLGERPDGVTLLGGLIVLAGVAWIHAGRARAARRAG